MIHQVNRHSLSAPFLQTLWFFWDEWKIFCFVSLIETGLIKPNNKFRGFEEEIGFKTDKLSLYSYSNLYCNLYFVNQTVNVSSVVHTLTTNGLAVAFVVGLRAVCLIFLFWYYIHSKCLYLLFIMPQNPLLQSITTVGCQSRGKSDNTAFTILLPFPFIGELMSKKSMVLYFGL